MQASDIAGQSAAYSDAFPSSAPVRLLVFADAFGASQSIAFVEGLAAARAAGGAAVRIIDEAAFGPDLGLRGALAARELAAAEIEQTGATAVVLSRFGHAAALEGILAAAREAGAPILAHIDDDLFDLPVTVGIERYRAARHPRRIDTLRRSLIGADLVISATRSLAWRVAGVIGHGRIGWLENGTAGTPLPRPARPADAPVVVGYMGSASHGQDLELAAPALNALLASGRKLRVELFGSIAKQPAADLLPASVVRHKLIEGDYSAFKRKLLSLDWDVGLAPLHATPYNRCKTATKWAEYAEAGVAVVASDIEVYQPMIAVGAAWPAAPGQWEQALGRLIDSAALRRTIVRSADDLLRTSFGWDRLQASLLGLIARAAPRRAAA